MCGIFGYIDFESNKEKHPIDELKKSLEIISYRGPDHSGFKTFKDNNTTIFLGHNRLSIIDLSSAGNQPFSIGEDYHIIFNGEIYNYLELKDKLEKKGIIFYTNSDTEVLLQLYIDSGTKFFGELNGMWSFIIYDKKNGKIVASRDRFGIKPLYILDNGGDIFFASEIKQILPFLDKKEIDKEIVANYLHYYLLDYDENTFYKKIKKLEPSHNLIIDISTKETSIEKFWDFLPIDFKDGTEDEIVSEYKTLLNSSLSLRLRSDVKVGNTLSGGLDSSSIAVLAHQQTKGNFYNYSIISNDKSISEEEHVDTLIKENGLNVKKINFDAINPWEYVEKVIWHHDEPILSLSAVAHYKMMESLKNESDITVVLSGQGGDESLAGYNKYFYFNIKDLIKQGRYLSAFNEVLKTIPRLGSEFKWNYAKRYLTVFDKIKVNSSTLEDIIKLDKPISQIGAAKDLTERQIIDIKRFSVPALCHYEDRNSMAHSLEIRLPFLDYRLVNYSVNLPNDLKIKNGVTKQILRKSMTELPVSIRNRFDKKGFNINENHSTNPLFLNFFKTSFKESALHELDIINVDKLNKAINNEGNKMWERDLHRILFLEIWAKKFL